MLVTGVRTSDSVREERVTGEECAVVQQETHTLVGVAGRMERGQRRLANQDKIAIRDRPKCEADAILLRQQQCGARTLGKLASPREMVRVHVSLEDPVDLRAEVADTRNQPVGARIRRATRRRLGSRVYGRSSRSLGSITPYSRSVTELTTTYVMPIASTQPWTSG